MTILVWYVSVSPAVMLSRVPIVLIFYVIGYKINSSPETVVEVFQPYIEMYHTSTILFGS